MLTHISIENFKGIRDRVEIELKPITLMFGPNSAGKSTILHALLYAQEVFERHNLDADRTAAGGQFIDLGGFKNMVHGHDPERPIGLGLRFNFDEGEWQDYQLDKGAQEAFECLLDCRPHRLLATPTSAGVLLQIRWSDRTLGPFVESCRLQLDSVDFAEITVDPSSESKRLHLLNPDHPLLVRNDSAMSVVETLAGEEPSDYIAGSVPSENRSVFHLALEKVAPFPSRKEIWLRGEEDALLRADSSVQLGPFIPMKAQSIQEAEFRHKVGSEIREFLDSTVTGILRAVRNRLRGFRYLGPVREIPCRNAVPPSSPDPSRWATGLGAWDHLQTCDATFVEEVSNWLSDPARLDTGVRLGRCDLIPLDFAQQVLAGLPSGRLSTRSRNQAARRLAAFPPDRSVKKVFLVPNEADIEVDLHDVGIGFSQLVPVVVTALDSKGRLAGIEAPEYHLHPRLQAELGDLLIEAAIRRRAVLLVETHSEHLILRIQRRIRETSSGKASAERAVTTDDVAVYHLRQKSGQAAVRRIDIDKHGEFVQPWPDDFFELDFYERFH